MANFKYRRPKNASRGGCLMCKPWKRVGCHTIEIAGQDRRTAERARAELRDLNGYVRLHLESRAADAA